MEGDGQTEMIKEILLSSLQRAMLGKLDPTKLSNETNLRSDIGLDSLGLIETVWAIEEKLSIHIDERLLGTTATVGDFVKLVIQLVNEAQGASAV